VNGKINWKGINLEWFVPFLFALFLFWFILFLNIPDSISQYFHTYSLGLFLTVIALYYVSFSLPGNIGAMVALGLTMALLSLSLSYMWTSGFSDNFVIGGLLPYKDGKNYYAGANLILNGLPMLNAGQATERPLFPGFLACLLWLTGQNLKISLGIIVQLVGVGVYLSALQICNLFGVLAASLFATLMYFYIQTFIGYTLSELLGLMAGCFGFAMILQASYRRKWVDLVLGVAVLLVGVSARAGAFLIFPMLALWIGWIFREKRSFDLKRAVDAFILILGLYFLINTVYSRLLGIPSGYSFENFSYALYGQVRGGTGWHRAIEELGTREPTVVYRAALDFFLKHPLSLAIGFAKSYRDFFWYGDSNVFAFNGQDWHHPVNIILWLAMIFLLLYGIFQLFKGSRLNSDSLLLAGFIGVFLSIPFLPPIDGGSRFHAGTMPFFFAALVAGIRGVSRGRQDQMNGDDPLPNHLLVSRSTSLLLLAMVLLVPLLIYKFGTKPALTGVECLADEQQFIIEAHPGSYIDLIKDKSAQCGSLPQVCLDDFEDNNVELKVDDYYQKLVAFAGSNSPNFRLIPAIDLIDNEFHYFYIPLDQLPRHGASDLITGCGIEVKTRNQSIFQVKSVLSKEK
jgi:hypothetical protein